MTHPYDKLPPEAFWGSAVADQDPPAIRGVWQPKFPIRPADPVATAGSCFAQNIGRALAERGFNWFEAEPTPMGLSDEDRKRFNYGVFSFRTANIYTTAMLRQWLEWAFEISKPPAEVWEEDGRVFDPFRPAIEPDGFESEAEMLASRDAALAGIRRAVNQAKVFTFTLGLTEGWINTQGGYVYSACPGTLRGRFDPKLHALRNFRHAEILADLTAALDIAREVKPSLRILLTVSPVPMTATASGRHVLVANGYSKSVLRAVAGEYVEGRDYADYFPSYELVTGAPFRARFYAGNMRSVSPEGVAFVMDHFFRALGVQDAPPPAPPKKREPVMTKDDIVCEEELLEQFNNA
jgi:hypothetical protein